jgi:alkaline phosphatase D
MLGYGRRVEGTVTRRELAAAGGGVALGAWLGAVPGWARRRPPGLLRSGSFPSGVMAGRPFQRGALLWTQLGPGEHTGWLRLEVARDPGFRRIVHERKVQARPNRDGVALARLQSRRLEPGAEYHYRFRTRTTSSPAGRFVTARPPDSREPLRIGFFSCQNYVRGYYTAHAGLASEQCDLIVCLGDYIYETNSDGSVPDRADRSSAADSGECELLDEYRAKYRLYRSDPDLRAMHASAAFVPTWDDHEVEDNYAGEHGGKTGDVPPQRRIPFGARRRNGYRAFFEQMPIRPTRGARFGLYRRVRLGIADLFVLDERHYRSDQTCNDIPGIPCPPPPRGHTLLGRRQMEWGKRVLSRSRAPWKVIASSVEMMGWESAPGVPLNRDGWDGYPADRSELGEHLLREGIGDVTVLTGDVHHFAAGVVTTNGNQTGTPFATEFVGGSVTSSLAGQPFADLAANSRRTNPHIAYMNFARRGYGVMELTPKRAQVSYRSPTTITERESPIETLARFRVPRGESRLQDA